MPAGAPDSSTALVRRATPDEASAIAAVLAEAFAEYEALYTPEALAATTPTAARIRERWDEGPVWVALVDGRLVGTVGAVVRADGLYVRSMAIRPEARGRGVGRHLLEPVERLARERGVVRLHLSTTPFLDRAIRLYERWGFVRTDAGPHELHGTALFTMEKRLTRSRPA